MDYVFTIVCRLTGYIVAIPCKKQGVTSKRAVESFLSRRAFFMGLPSRIMSDNASIINSAFFNTLCSPLGVEIHKSIIYWPQSNECAERAVQSVIDALGTFWEGRKQSWVTALPLALWGLNDLPGPVSPYSSHHLVFDRDPGGFWDASPYVDVDGCENAVAFFRRLSQDRETFRAELQAAHDRAYRKFLATYPEHVFRPVDRVCVQNCIEWPPLYPKLDRLWQGPAVILARVSLSTYRVSYNGVQQVLSTERLKPLLRSPDGTQPPLHYYSERDGPIETAGYLVERVLEHQWRLGKKVRKGPFPGTEPWFRVRFQGFIRPEWHPVKNFIHDIQDEWLQYCGNQKLDVGSKDLTMVGANVLAVQPVTSPRFLENSLVAGIRPGDGDVCVYHESSLSRHHLPPDCGDAMHRLQGLSQISPEEPLRSVRRLCVVWELVFGTSS